MPSALITSRDPKGLQAVNVFEAAYNKANLDDGAAQLLNERGDQLKTGIAELIARLSVKLTAGLVINLGDGWSFTIEEVLDLAVDYALTPAEISKRSNLGDNDWEYVGTAPGALGQRKVKALVGRLNRNWTEEQVTGLLAKPGCLLKGSGAWVGDAYLSLRPNYDGKGNYIGFPDAGTSRWRLVRVGDVYFPFLWYDHGWRWYRRLRWVGSERRASLPSLPALRVAALGHSGLGAPRTPRSLRFISCSNAVHQRGSALSC